MKLGWKMIVGTIVLGTFSGCGQPPETAADVFGEFRPTGTIKDIMDSIVDPSADAIWESVATVIDAEGIHEEFPETEEEWAGVRRQAIRIIEATNLLLVPGRQVAEPNANSEYPDIELEPAQIQELIDQDWATWIDRAHGLHDMATMTLDAIDARDTEALLSSGQGLDLACEGCHVNYWYPADSEARRMFEENRRSYLESLGESQ